MWIPFLVVAAWPFWVLSLAAFVLLAILIDSELAFAGFLCVAGWMLVAAMFSNFNPFAWLVHHWDTTLLFIVVYLFVGVVYGIIKWYFHVLNAADKYRENEKRYKDEYQNANSYRSTVGLSYEQWVQLNYRVKPEPSYEKHRIIVWMAYWPASAALTLLREPLRRFFTMIYHRLLDIYQSIVTSVFKRFDFNVTRPAPSQSEAADRATRVE